MATMRRQGPVLLTLSVALVTALVAQATPAGPTSGGYSYDANVCSDFGDGSVGFCVDPGSFLGQQNPELLVPGADGLRVQATILDDAGKGVADFQVEAVVEAHVTTNLTLDEVSAGIHQSGRLPYEGGAVSVVVTFDRDGDGAPEHTINARYDPVPLA